MDDINIVGEVEDEEPCGLGNPHLSHQWASQVQDGIGTNYVLFLCPGW